MDLLVFAHFNEARVFIERWGLVKKSTLPSSVALFSGNVDQKPVDVLVLGEGIQRAILGMTAYLAARPEVIERYRSDFRILNAGVALGLYKGAQVGEIAEVGVVYWEHEKKYYALNANVPVECLTTASRLLTVQEKEAAAARADLVDRELWGICFAAMQWGLPVQAFKLLSDTLDTSISCQEIRATEWSEPLWNYYMEHKLAKESSPNKPTSSFTDNVGLSALPFHLTDSEQKEVRMHLRKLAQGRSLEICLQDVRARFEEAKRNKVKGSGNFVGFLRNLVDPQKEKIGRKLRAYQKNVLNKDPSTVIVSLDIQKQSVRFETGLQEFEQNLSELQRRAAAFPVEDVKTILLDESTGDRLKK